MRRLLLVMALAAGGCGGGGGGGEDAAHPVPDGFLQTMCSEDVDCDDANPCTTDSCSTIQGCLHTPKNCSGVGDECNSGSCNPQNGNCIAMPANDGQFCTTGAGQPGTCVSGACQMAPQCTIDNTYFLDCSVPSVSSLTIGPSAITDYTCLTGESAAEKAYEFQIYNNRTVTVSISNAVVPLDLVVLDGATCVGSANCEGSARGTVANPASVTFNALAGQTYLFVVDGQGTNAGNFTLNLQCQTCMPISTLTCNTSVMGDTTSANATNAIPSYYCAATETGPEETYSLTPAVDTDYNISLTGLSTDLDLIVVDGYGGECDNNYCDAYSLNNGTANESVSFHGYSGGVYDVVVDSKSTGGPYLLEVDCPPSCLGSSSIDCYSLADMRRNDDGVRSKDVVDSWGSCDSNTTGPEVVYQFYPPSTGNYTFTLTGLTADLDLIVMTGTYSTCDPTTACVASSTNSGTADESVTFAGDPTKIYYIAVDGKAGAVSPYTLKLKSTQCPGPSCYDGTNHLSCSYLEETRRNDDATHSTNRIDTWACDANTSGPEVVYPFTPPYAGSYTVTVDGLTDNLDLIVVSDPSAYSCNSSSACIGSSTNSGTTSESVTFTADTVHTYYIGVDGVNGATSPYHLKLSGALCPAPLCTDGFRGLSCSSLVLSNRNDASGATSDITQWGSAASPCDTGTNGPEFAHFFSPSGAGPYTITMNGLSDNLDLIVLETSAESSCDATACVAASTNSGTADEHVTFTANPGKYYWIVVDGVNGATSRYFLEVTSGCP